LSSRPERSAVEGPAVRLSRATAVKESRMKFANATKFNRKLEAAKWRDLMSPSAAPMLSLATPVSDA
jgi:hypothetical protein